MAEKTKATIRRAAAPHDRETASSDFSQTSETQGERTRRYLGLMREDADDTASATLRDVAGIRYVASAADWDDGGEFKTEVAAVPRRAGPYYPRTQCRGFLR
jgi:hypothetical protein